MTGVARNGTEAEKEKIEALWWCEGVREGPGYKKERKNETKREREREGGRQTESGGVRGREGERRRKRQIEVESGEGGRGGMLLPLWSFASSGAAGERFYGRK